MDAPERAHRRPRRHDGAAWRCAGRFRPWLGKARAAMASWCSGGTTKGDLGLVGALGKHCHMHVRAAAETHRWGLRSGEVRGVEV